VRNPPVYIRLACLDESVVHITLLAATRSLISFSITYRTITYPTAQRTLRELGVRVNKESWSPIVRNSGFKPCGKGSHKTRRRFKKPLPGCLGKGQTPSQGRIPGIQIAFSKRGTPDRSRCASRVASCTLTIQKFNVSLRGYALQGNRRCFT